MTETKRLEKMSRELLREITGNKLSTEYTRQREKISRWKKRLSDGKCYKDTKNNMAPGRARS